MPQSIKPFIVTVMSTKGGVTKSTNVANIGAFCADHGIRTLMIDTDSQPTLSSYYHLNYTAPQGLFEFLTQRVVTPELIISQTEFENLDIIQSNDPTDAITTYLRNAPDGMLRFTDVISEIKGYDLIIIDTRGTSGITVDMSVLASDLVLSPLKPELLSAREFMRGTVGLYQQLQTWTKFGFTLPPVKAVINCLDRTTDAKNVVSGLQQLFEQYSDSNLTLLDFSIPSRVAYREAASLALPVHRHSEKEKQNIQQLCTLLFPQWTDRFNQ